MSDQNNEQMDGRINKLGKEQINQQTVTQKRYQTDGNSCLTSNANDDWGKKKNWHGKTKTCLLRQRLEIKSGCAIPSVANEEVFKRGSPSLVASRPEAPKR